MLWGIGNLSVPLLAGAMSEISSSSLPFLLVAMTGLFLVSTMERWNLGVEALNSSSS